MRRLKTAPVNVADLPDTMVASTSRARIFSLDPDTGGRTFMMFLPPGWRAGNGRAGEFEFHRLDEETFSLGGSLSFDGWYDLGENEYLYHPGYWVHPSLQTTDGGATLLIKISEAVDFQYQPIPERWDGVEFFAPGAAQGRNLPGLTRLHLDDIPWEPVRSTAGSPLGYDAKTLYQDDDGWTTWLMRVPAGWLGAGPRRVLAGGDECFVLQGDRTLGDAAPIRLAGGSYYCDPDQYVEWGQEESSEGGCQAIRWTREFPHQLPEIRY